MIPYEELDRALARWKSRVQGTAAGEPLAVVEESAVVVAAVVGDETPPPVNPDELDIVAEHPPGAPVTGEVDLADVESYSEE